MKPLLFLIKLYQKTANGREVFLNSLFGSSFACKFEPTCSIYCYQAIDKYGMITGSFKCLLRIIRCNPFNKGGLDPLK